VIFVFFGTEPKTKRKARTRWGVAMTPDKAYGVVKKPHITRKNNRAIGGNVIFGFFGTKPKTVSAKRDRNGMSHKAK